MSLRSNDRYVITKIQLRKIVERDIQLDSLTKRYNQLIDIQREIIEPSIIQTKQAFILSDQQVTNFEKVVKIDKGIIKKQGLKNLWLKIRLPVAFISAFYIGNVLAQKGIKIIL